MLCKLRFVSRWNQRVLTTLMTTHGTSALHSHQYRRNSRADRRLDCRRVHFDLTSISQLISTELFVSLEIYDDPAVSLLKGEIDNALDEHAIGIAPYNWHFTTTPPLLRGIARLLQKRMRERSVHRFRSGFYFFLSGAKYTVMDGCEMLDHAQIAV